MFVVSVADVEEQKDVSQLEVNTPAVGAAPGPSQPAPPSTSKQTDMADPLPTRQHQDQQRQVTEPTFTLTQVTQPPVPSGAEDNTQVIAEVVTQEGSTLQSHENTAMGHTATDLLNGQVDEVTTVEIPKDAEKDVKVEEIPLVCGPATEVSCVSTAQSTTITQTTPVTLAVSREVVTMSPSTTITNTLTPPPPLTKVAPNPLKLLVSDPAVVTPPAEKIIYPRIRTTSICAPVLQDIKPLLPLLDMQAVQMVSSSSPTIERQSVVCQATTATVTKAVSQPGIASSQLQPTIAAALIQPAIPSSQFKATIATTQSKPTMAVTQSRSAIHSSSLPDTTMSCNLSKATVPSSLSKSTMSVTKGSRPVIHATISMPSTFSGQTKPSSSPVPAIVASVALTTSPLPTMHPAASVMHKSIMQMMSSVIEPPQETVPKNKVTSTVSEIFTGKVVARSPVNVVISSSCLTVASGIPKASMTQSTSATVTTQTVTASIASIIPSSFPSHHQTRPTLSPHKKSISPLGLTSTVASLTSQLSGTLSSPITSIPVTSVLHTHSRPIVTASVAHSPPIVGMHTKHGIQGGVAKVMPNGQGSVLSNKTIKQAMSKMLPGAATRKNAVSAMLKAPTITTISHQPVISSTVDSKHAVSTSAGELTIKVEESAKPAVVNVDKLLVTGVPKVCEVPKLGRMDTHYDKARTDHGSHPGPNKTVHTLIATSHQSGVNLASQADGHTEETDNKNQLLEEDSDGTQWKTVPSKGISILKPLYDRDAEIEQELDTVSLTEKKKPKCRKTSKDNIIIPEDIAHKSDTNAVISQKSSKSATIAKILHDAKVKAQAEQASVKPSQTVAAMVSKENTVQRMTSLPSTPSITPAKTAKSALAKATPTSGLRPQTVSALADFEFPRNSNVHLTNFVQKSIHTPTHTLPNSSSHGIMAPSFCLDLTHSVQQVMKGALSPPLDPPSRMTLPVPKISSQTQDKSAVYSPTAKVLNTLPTLSDITSSAQRRSPIMLALSSPSTSPVLITSKHLDTNSVSTADRVSPKSVVIKSVGPKSEVKLSAEGSTTTVQHSKVMYPTVKPSVTCTDSRAAEASPSQRSSEIVRKEQSSSIGESSKVSSSQSGCSDGIVMCEVVSVPPMENKCEEKVDSGIESSSTGTPASSDTSSVSSLPIIELACPDVQPTGVEMAENPMEAEVRPLEPIAKMFNEEVDAFETPCVETKSVEVNQPVLEANEPAPEEVQQPVEVKQVASEDVKECVVEHKNAQPTQVITLTGAKPIGPSTVLVVSEGMFTRKRSSNSESHVEPEVSEVLYTPAKSTRSSHRSSTESQKSTDDLSGNIRPARITRRHSRGSTESRSGSTESGKSKEESPKIITPRSRKKSDSSDIMETRSSRSTETPSPTLLRATRSSTRSGRKRSSPSPDLTVPTPVRTSELPTSGKVPESVLTADSDTPVKVTRGSKRRLAMEDAVEESSEKKAKIEETCKDNQENVGVEEDIDGSGDAKGKKISPKTGCKSGAKLEDKSVPKGRKQSNKEDNLASSRTTNTATTPSKGKSNRADIEATLEDHSYIGSSKRSKTRTSSSGSNTRSNSRESKEETTKEDSKGLDEASIKKGSTTRGRSAEKRPKSPTIGMYKWIKYQLIHTIATADM